MNYCNANFRINVSSSINHTRVKRHYLDAITTSEDVSFPVFIRYMEVNIYKVMLAP